MPHHSAPLKVLKQQLHMTDLHMTRQLACRHGGVSAGLTVPRAACPEQLAEGCSWHADVRMLDGAPKTPWRLKDYDPSPELLQRPKRPRYSMPSSLQPPAPEVAPAEADREADGPAELAPVHDDGAEHAGEHAQPEQDAHGGHDNDYDDADE